MVKIVYTTIQSDAETEKTTGERRAERGDPRKRAFAEQNLHSYGD